MDLKIPFEYRNTVYEACIYFSFDEEPCYLFTTLTDKQLIKEFGEEITIKTDCNILLPKKDDYPELLALRQAIFDAVKKTRAFEIVKTQYNLTLKSAKRTGNTHFHY